MSKSKEWFKSKTFWVAVVTIAIGALESATGILSPETAGYVVTAVGVLNLILRSITTQPLRV